MTKLRLARVLPLIGFAAVVCTALGTMVGLAVRPVAAPADLAVAPVADQAEVTRQRFDDQRTVPVRFSMSRGISVASPGQGRVTSSTCKPGRELRSGKSLGRIDDTPVLALHTSVPLYRDLAAGSRGRDVRALQRELDRLGLKVKITGYYGSMTTAAVRTLQRRAGALEPTGRLALDRVVWLSRHSVTPTSCDTKVGDQVTPGTVWAKVAGGLSRVEVELPAGMVPGKRQLTLFGQRTGLGERASTTEAAFLGKVEATPEFAAHRRDGGGDDLTATVALSSPLNTYKVPPAALFGLEGRRACVETGHQVVGVQLVGSGLGASLVTASTPLHRVDLGSAITATDCGQGR